MKFVLDTNILFSALIKDGQTRQLILNYDDLFLCPSYVLEEMEEHLSELVSKSTTPQQAVGYVGILFAIHIP